MRGLWALPALVRLALASQHSFSVHDDLLAFPQYRVAFTESGISEEQAEAFLASTKERNDASSSTTADLAQTMGEGASNPFKEASRDDTEEDEVAAIYERMVLDSHPYLCRIPVVETEDNNTNASSNARDPVEEEKELARASDRGWELLRGMQDNCIYFLSGWWSYSFCYNKGVKQFHQLPPGRGVPMYPPVEDESVHSFILGKFPKDKRQKKNPEQVDDEDHSSDEGSAAGETSVAKLETKGETRYLVQKLTGGTTCDLTGKDRKIEVQFHCHPNTPDRIGMIKEVSTCAYLMVIYTPRLCNDVAFLPPQENRAHHIACALIKSSTDADLPQSTKPKDSEPTIEDIQALLGHDGQSEDDISAAVLEALGYGTSGSMPVIGGTIVGAQSLVGSPGKVIEKSVVVGGGKETLLATVAESDGRGNQKVMSAEQLRKLDIKDPKDVDDLRKRLGNMAGDRGWKLELVNTPRGREFRGILLDGDDDGEYEGTAEEHGEAENSEENGQEGAGEGSEETFFKEEL